MKRWVLASLVLMPACESAPVPRSSVDSATSEDTTDEASTTTGSLPTTGTAGSTRTTGDAATSNDPTSSTARPGLSRGPNGDDAVTSAGECVQLSLGKRVGAVLLLRAGAVT